MVGTHLMFVCIYIHFTHILLRHSYRGNQSKLFLYFCCLINCYYNQGCKLASVGRIQSILRQPLSLYCDVFFLILLVLLLRLLTFLVHLPF